MSDTLDQFKTASGQWLPTDQIMRERCSTCNREIVKRDVLTHRGQCLERLRSDPEFALQVIFDRLEIYAHRKDAATDDERATWQTERDLCFIVIHIEARPMLRSLFTADERDALSICSQRLFDQRSA